MWITLTLTLSVQLGNVFFALQAGDKTSRGRSCRSSSACTRHCDSCGRALNACLRNEQLLRQKQMIVRFE